MTGAKSPQKRQVARPATTRKTESKEASIRTATKATATKRGSGVNLPGYLLAVSLKRYRLQRGQRHEDLAALGYGSRSKWSELENFDHPYKLADVIALCELFQVPLSQTAQMKKWARQARAVNWADGESPLLADDSQWSTYLGSEGLAVGIRIASHVIPGLLQARGYAELAASVPGMSPERLDKVVGLRFDRQDQHIGRAVVEVALGEEALYRFGGIPAIMDEQIRHLLYLVERGADIRILPYDSGGLLTLWGEVTILTFPEDTGLTPVIYEEGHSGGKYSSTPGVVGRTITRTTAMFEQAVPIKEFLE
ncbi:helix-turn-helix domain-containing protein [Kineosporia mesophila]|nr:helix-turn-helix transcriptional regulator [Kineosporia mesophila]MCD5349792.1 helix-turn-helix domain-containing protein [Kineosporia mesophila]